MSQPPDPERIAAAIADAHIKAITVALQTLQPHLVTVIQRAISEARGGEDTWRQHGDVIKEDVFNKINPAGD
jgi:hypothetical protein